MDIAASLDMHHFDITWSTFWVNLNFYPSFQVALPSSILCKRVLSARLALPKHAWILHYIYSVWVLMTLYGTKVFRKKCLHFMLCQLNVITTNKMASQNTPGYDEEYIKLKTIFKRGWGWGDTLRTPSQVHELIHDLSLLLSEKVWTVVQFSCTLGFLITDSLMFTGGEEHERKYQSMKRMTSGR